MKNWLPIHLCPKNLKYHNGIAKVLAYSQEKGVVIVRCVVFGSGSIAYCCDNTNTRITDITHWMPLPKNPTSDSLGCPDCENEIPTACAECGKLACYGCGDLLLDDKEYFLCHECASGKSKTR